MNAEQDADANCRLKNNLNPDVLAKIFEYLDICDLMTLALMNSHYKQIIADYIIPKVKPCVGISCPVDNEQLFSIFGKRLKKFRFAGRTNHLYELLNNIVSYCSDTKFIDVEMDLDFQKIDLDEDFLNSLQSQCLIFLMNEAQKSFWDLEKLAIHGGVLGAHYVYNELFRNSLVIRCLKLQRTSFHQEVRFFNGIRFTNLTELELIRASVDEKLLCNFLQTKPRLCRFVNDRSIFPECMEKIGRKLVEFCKDTLHTFCDLDNNRYDLDGFRYDERRYDYYLNRYNFIVELSNLKEVALTSYFTCANDLYCPLLALSRLNKLEILGIFQFAPRCDMKTLPLSNRQLRLHLERFTNLRTIKICAINVESRPDSPTHFEFLIENSSQILQNVSQLHVIGTCKFIYPSKMVQLMPNLRLLSVSDLEHFDSDLVICDLKNILNARKNITNDYVELVLDKARFKELNTLYCSDVLGGIRFKAVDNRGQISIATDYDGIFH